ncbi:hypothetical protein ACVWYG_003188 [Pedobacter sp. UYEF25]
MLENLIQLVRDNVQESVVNNNEIPNEKNDEVIHAASTSIFDTLKDKLASGNASELANVFNNGNAENSPVAQQAAGSFTDKLAGMGINANTAKTIAASVIPMIIAKLTKKTADPSDSSFNIKDILGSLTGGSGDGGLDLGSVMGMFNGSGNDGNKQQSSGDMMDKLKGLF